MKYIKKFNSIIEFKNSILSLVYPCISLIYTPAGKSIGYLKSNKSTFYIKKSLISTDNLKTLDFSKSTEVDANAVLNIIDTWKEGDKMVFSNSVAEYLKDKLVLRNGAYWKGNVLDSDYPYLRITYNDGTVSYYEVTTIKSTTILNKEKVTKAEIGNLVTNIGTNAFYLCSGLTSVTIPNSVTSIGNEAFYGCSGLTSVTLNANDIVSKTYTSYDGNLGTIFGSQVKEYVLGDDVKGIGYYAFYKCTGLTSVTIPSSVTSIGSYAFSGCTGLTSVTIPNSVTSIGSSAFTGCSGLTSVTIPNSVTNILAWIFFGCSSLTSISIPNSVTRIGDCAFNGCSNLKSLICTTTIPPTVLSTSILSTITSIYVPDASVDAYKTATNWNSYASKIKPMSELNQ